MVAVEGLEEPVVVDEVTEAGAQLDEGEVDALGVELVVEALEHSGRGDVDVGDGLALQHHPRRPALLHQLAHLVGEDAGVGEEQRRLPAEHHHVGVLHEAVAALVAVPALAAGHPSEHLAVRPPVPLEEEQDRQHDGDDDAFEDAEEDDAGAGDEREHHRGASEPSTPGRAGRSRRGRAPRR